MALINLRLQKLGSIDMFSYCIGMVLILRILRIQKKERIGELESLDTVQGNGRKTIISHSSVCLSRANFHDLANIAAKGPTFSLPSTASSRLIKL